MVDLRPLPVVLSKRLVLLCQIPNLNVSLSLKTFFIASTFFP
jgi:hypothetical protein